MKNLIGIMAIALLFIFASTQSADAQANYSVTFGWNDVACECSEPLIKEVRISLYTYPGNELIQTTSWETVTSNPYTVYSTVDELDDCQTDCYKVVAEISYSVNGVECCYGSGFETFTGSELSNGATFTLTIPLL